MLYIDNMNLNTPNAEDAVNNVVGQLDEAEHLTEEARKLLVRCETALSGEGVREEALALERWIESYRRGLSAARKLAETGPEILDDMSTRVRQALEELHRYEAEGGNAAATKSQQTQMEELTRAMQAISELSDSLQDATLVTKPKKHATKA